ncbi:MAG TPA: GtrA family protein [Ktedonobacteraceae bacterium]|jgi:putative flippase GtrA|nr:GtrA family protein [Ktedonobacteraceae bacterium]
METWRRNKKRGDFVIVNENKRKTKNGKAFQYRQKSTLHRFHAWSSTFQQFLRYCLVGGVNTLIDVLVLNALLWRFPTHNVQFLVVENSLAYAGGAVSSFFLNKYWTFQRTQRPTRREVGRFLISVALELISNDAFLWLAGMALSSCITNGTVWGNASKLLAVAANALLSYLVMRFWVFASGPQKHLKQRVPINERGSCASGMQRDPADEIS